MAEPCHSRQDLLATVYDMLLVEVTSVEINLWQWISLEKPQAHKIGIQTERNSLSSL